VTVPLAPFQAERYLIDLRDRTAGAAPGTPRECAWLWTCGVLDVRQDCILIPVLVTCADLPLEPTLECQNRDRAWGLPGGWFAERLARGGCLLFLDGAEEAARMYPRCRAWF
jgi:hypothetical protein